MLLRKILEFVLCVPIILVMIGVTLTSMSFQKEIIDSLRRAADSDAVESAVQSLSTALHSIEARKLTTGSTSVLYLSPNEDLGLWYSQLSASLKELKAAQSASPAKQRVALQKVRSGLIEKSWAAEIVVFPPGAERFPNNKLWSFAVWVSLLLSAIGYYLIIKHSF